MCKNIEFDTIYHEHINFYNTNSMNTLVDRAGLKLHNIIKSPIHGTSYIFVIKIKSNQKNKKYLISEKYYSLKFYLNWARKCEKKLN